MWNFNCSVVSAFIRLLVGQHEREVVCALVRINKLFEILLLLFSRVPIKIYTIVMHMCI